jgi:DNA-directed RNA polymerase specialized sigma24 family protein
MACKEESRKEAEEAFAEFYRRYGRYVLKISLNACKGLNKGRGINCGQQIAEDIFMNVMNKAFEKAIDFDDGNITDSKLLNARICAWLKTIAMNELYQILKNDPNIKLRLVTEELKTPNHSSVRKSPELLLLNEALEKVLSEEEYDIVITTFKFEQEGKYTPRDIMRDLCERYDTKPENIRQKKKRALDKLKKYCNLKPNQN